MRQETKMTRPGEHIKCKWCGHWFSIDTISPWTKVSDRLPEANDEYIVILTYEELGKPKRSVTVGRYYTSDKMWFVDGEQNFNVTHWIPYPDPPEEEPNDN